MRKSVKIIAFDLDGTLTQHKTKLGVQNQHILEQLDQHYKLIMVGAGTCQRIWNQMDQYPIDIIGSYGMESWSSTGLPTTPISNARRPLKLRCGNTSTGCISVTMPPRV